MKSADEWFKGFLYGSHISIDEIRAIQADAARAQRQSDAEAPAEEWRDTVLRNPLVTDEASDVA